MVIIIATEKLKGPVYPNIQGKTSSCKFTIREFNW